MKISFLAKIVALNISSLLLFQTATLAQVVSTDLAAIGNNGKISIKVTNAVMFPTYFTLNNGLVDLDFYFGPDDPRNGIYAGSPVPQPTGEIFIRFDGLNYENGDTLTFYATELLGGITPKYYVFVRGDFFPESTDPITVCPFAIGCVGKSIWLYFDPSDVVISPGNSTPITLDIPSINVNGIYEAGAYSPAYNALVFRFLSSLECEQMLEGTATVTVNGIVCHFENGQLTCPPWFDVPGDLSNACVPYFDNCLTELIELITGVQYTIPCQQWVSFEPCSTTSTIHRTEKVAIGTANYAPNISLTVKNGIITDKVKVINCCWADYILEKEYELMPLEDVESYIARYHHLPGIPSQKTVESDGGFELGHITTIHQAEIEKIFLYLIQLESEIGELEALLYFIQYVEHLQRK